MGMRTMTIKGYGSESSVIIGAGFLAELNTSTHFFADARSVNKEMTLSAGLHQLVSEEVMLGVCLIKNSSMPLLVQSQVLYKPVSKVEVDIGFITGIHTVYMLTGYQLKGFKLRAGARFGNFIGTVPSTAIMYAR
jgi:hypothetical protein